MDSGDVGERSPERMQLLERLNTAFGGQPVTPAFWACCHVAFIEPLKSLVEIAEKNRNVVQVVGNSSGLIASSCEFISWVTI